MHNYKVTVREVREWTLGFLWRIRYAFKEPEHTRRYGNYLSRAWCRWKGHPCDVVWYNPGGWEPDMHCKECGEDLS